MMPTTDWKLHTHCDISQVIGVGGTVVQMLQSWTTHRRLYSSWSKDLLFLIVALSVSCGIFDDVIFIPMSFGSRMLLLPQNTTIVLLSSWMAP